MIRHAEMEFASMQQGEIFQGDIPYTQVVHRITVAASVAYVFHVEVQRLGYSRWERIYTWIGEHHSSKGWEPSYHEELAWHSKIRVLVGNLDDCLPASIYCTLEARDETEKETMERAR